MKLLSGLVSEISSVVDTLAVSSKEKKQIEADLVAGNCPAGRGFESEPVFHYSGRGSGQLAATFVAAYHHACLCNHCPDRHFFRFAYSFRYFPFLGFTGNRNRRLRDRAECGKNHRSFERRQVMKIEAHQLVGSCVEYLRCTKCSRLLETIDTVVLHSTDGANAMSSAHYLARNDTSVSAHLVVARSGRVIQLLPFNVRAWHAGVSEYEGRKQLNDFSVGIEIDNAGRLHRRGNSFFSWFNREYPPGEVFTTVENGHAAYYHGYTREQIGRVAEICALLKARYLIRRLLRHSDITVRKTDPGPAFPFDEVKGIAGF